MAEEAGDKKESTEGEIYLTFPTSPLSFSSRETDCSCCRIMPTSPPLNLAAHFFFSEALRLSPRPGALEPNSELPGNFPRLRRR